MEQSFFADPGSQSQRKYIGSWLKTEISDCFCVLYWNLLAFIILIIAEIRSQITIPKGANCWWIASAFTWGLSSDGGAAALHLQLHHLILRLLIHTKALDSSHFTNLHPVRSCMTFGIFEERWDNDASFHKVKNKRSIPTGSKYWSLIRNCSFC